MEKIDVYDAGVAAHHAAELLSVLSRNYFDDSLEEVTEFPGWLDTNYEEISTLIYAALEYARQASEKLEGM